MRRFQASCVHLVAAIVVAGGVYHANHVQAQDKAVQAQGKSPSQKATNQAGQADNTTHADHHSPELGVLVGSCPGEGVCVIDTLRRGPADRVGIEPGDYILAINDQTVSNPQELKQKIEKLDSDDTIDVSLWRRGKFVTKEVRLARESDQLPESHRGWLGVVLAPAAEGEKGAAIQEVATGSPAEQAGLKRGDEVVELNGNDVQSLEQFVDDVSDFEPGHEINMTIRRDGDEKKISAKLGEVVEAPVQWFRHEMSPPRGMLGGSMPGFRPQSGSPVMDNIINDMRRQIRTLRKEVDQLKQSAPSGKQSVPSGKQAEKAEKVAPQDDDVSLIQNERGLSSNTATVPHIPGQASMRDRLVLAQINGNFPPNISNDWSGARYSSPNYEGWRNNQQQSTGSNYGNTYYRYPNYNSRYGNYRNGYNRFNNYRYYRYRGRPYYYGGGYPYGYRGGVGFGTGLGVYW